jgi:hypothetical protein
MALLFPKPGAAQTEEPAWPEELLSLLPATSGLVLIMDLGGIEAAYPELTLPPALAEMLAEVPPPLAGEGDIFDLIRRLGVDTTRPVALAGLTDPSGDLSAAFARSLELLTGGGDPVEIQAALRSVAIAEPQDPTGPAAELSGRLAAVAEPPTAPISLRLLMPVTATEIFYMLLDDVYGAPRVTEDGARFYDELLDVGVVAVREASGYLVFDCLFGAEEVTVADLPPVESTSPPSAPPPNPGRLVSLSVDANTARNYGAVAGLSNMLAALDTSMIAPEDLQTITTMGANLVLGFINLFFLLSQPSVDWTFEATADEIIVRLIPEGSETIDGSPTVGFIEVPSAVLLQVPGAPCSDCWTRHIAPELDATLGVLLEQIMTAGYFAYLGLPRIATRFLLSMPAGFDEPFPQLAAWEEVESVVFCLDEAMESATIGLVGRSGLAPDRLDRWLGCLAEGTAPPDCPSTVVIGGHTGEITTGPYSGWSYLVGDVDGRPVLWLDEDPARAALMAETAVSTGVSGVARASFDLSAFGDPIESIFPDAPGGRLVLILTGSGRELVWRSRVR